MAVARLHRPRGWHAGDTVTGVAGSPEVTKAASPAARLLGFVILLAAIFALAYVVGSRLGPIAVTHAPSGRGVPMRMSGPAAHAPALDRTGQREAGR